MKILLSITALFLLAVFGFAEPAFSSEEEYTSYLQSRIGGKQEVTLSDRTRCDLLTHDHAFEVERARRWAQAIGQSLHYAHMTGRQPAIALLVDSEDNGRYFRRIVGVINEFDLPIFLMLIDIEFLRLSEVEVLSR